MNNFNFKLSKPVEIAKKGEVELVFELDIRAPTGANRAQLIRIKQGFFKMIMQSSATEDGKAADKEKDGGNPLANMNGNQVMMLFYMADIDLPALEEEFKRLLSQGGAFADGVQLTPYHLDKLDFEEFERLMGEYIKVFIAPSLTQI